MSEAYVIAGSTGPVQVISSTSKAEQVRPVLDELLKKTGVPAQRIQEIHWLGGDDELWLTAIEVHNGQAARFQWPSSPLLAHFVLQSCGRAIEAGERDLLLMAQETGGQAVILMLASPSAVGRYNLSPCLRIGHRFSLSSGSGSLAAAARSALEKTELDPGEVQWLASSRILEPQSSDAVFPSAQWLRPGDGLPSGDLFLLYAMAERLEKKKLAWLLSLGPQQSGLGTLLERV